MTSWTNSKDIDNKILGRPVEQDTDSKSEYTVKKTLMCSKCKRPNPDNGKGYCKICSRKL